MRHMGPPPRPGQTCDLSASVPRQPRGAGHTAPHQATAAAANLLFRKSPHPGIPASPLGKAPDPSGETAASGGRARRHVMAQADLGGGKAGTEAGQTKASGSGGHPGGSRRPRPGASVQLRPASGQETTLNHQPPLPVACAPGGPPSGKAPSFPGVASPVQGGAGPAPPRRQH